MMKMSEQRKQQLKERGNAWYVLNQSFIACICFCKCFIFSKKVRKKESVISKMQISSYTKNSLKTTFHFLGSHSEVYQNEFFRENLKKASWVNLLQKIHYKHTNYYMNFIRMMHNSETSLQRTSFVVDTSLQQTFFSGTDEMMVSNSHNKTSMQQTFYSGPLAIADINFRLQFALPLRTDLCIVYWTRPITGHKKYFL